MPTTSKSFTHSGTLGDVLTSLCIVKLLGGGDFYLRLNNMDKMIQEKLSKGDLVLVPSGAISVKVGGMPYLFDEKYKKPFLAIFEIALMSAISVRGFDGVSK